MSEKIRLAGIAQNSLVNGTGLRKVFFSQGCTHKCKECFSPFTWDFKGGKLIDIDELVKQVKALAEEGKIALRNIRQDANNGIKKLELPEDEEKGMEKDIQEMVNEYNKKIEAKLKEKEDELLTV